MTMIDHRVNSRCPFCAARATGALGMPGSDERPRPDDINVCFYCHEVSIWDDEMELRRPTEGERISALLHDETRKAIQAVTAMPKWPHPDHPTDVN